MLWQGQPPPEGDGDSEQKQDQGEDKKQKENTAYAKKMVMRLAGLMGIGGAVGMVYVFGESAFSLFGPLHSVRAAACQGLTLNQQH